jgi:integrase
MGKREGKAETDTTKKTANGLGTIDQLPSGLWRWRVSVKTSTGKRVRLSGTTKTETLAKRALNKAVTDNERGLLSAPDRTPLHEYARTWLDRQKELRASSRATYWGELAHVLEIRQENKNRGKRSERPEPPKDPRSQFGKLAVRDVRAIHIRTALSNAADTVMDSGKAKGKTMSARTLGKILTALRAVFREAVIDQVIHVNPCDGVKRVKRQSAALEHVGRVLDFPEFARFLEVGDALHRAGFLRLWPALHVAVLIGLRRGEVMGLRWADVDFDNNLLRIRQARVISEGKPLNGPTKTDGSKRDIPMSARLRAVLLEHKENQAAQLAKIGTSNPTGAVFASIEGEYTHPADMDRAVKILVEWSDPNTSENVRRWRAVPHIARPALETALKNGAKLTHISPHDLRHTFATLALRRGERVEIVSRMLGHAKISITLDTYRHVLPSELKAIDLLDTPVPSRVENSASQTMN